MRNAELEVLFEIIDKNIQAQVNNFINRISDQKVLMKYFPLIIFLTNNTFYSDKDIFIKKSIKKINDVLNTNFEFTFKPNDKTDYMEISNENEIYGYLKTNGFNDYVFLNFMTKLIFFTLKKMDLIERYKNTLNLLQNVLDKSNNVILILDEEKMVEKYNFQALNFFGEKIVKSNINDLIKLNNYLFEIKNDYDQNKDYKIVDDSLIKIMVSKYKDNYILEMKFLEIENQLVFNNFADDMELIFKEDTFYYKYFKNLKKVINTEYSIELNIYDKTLFFYDSNTNVSKLNNISFCINENYYLKFMVENKMDLTKNVVKNIEKILRLNFNLKKDKLTNLYNKNTFMKYFKSKFDANNPNLYLIIIDLDNFKKVNDTKGHMYGDNVLKEFSRNLIRHLRKEDFIARIGGDEFAILMENTTENIVVDIIERIVENNSTELKFSYGYTYINNNLLNYNEYFEIADEKMYKYKNNIKNGKNKSRKTDKIKNNKSKIK